MSSLTITAQKFLAPEVGSSITAETYFTQGGSLADIISRVRSLINENAFYNNLQLSTRVQKGIAQCIEYVKTLPPEGVMVGIGRLWSGKKSDKESVQEAERLYKLLDNRYLHPLSLGVIFEPEATLQSVMQTIASKVLKSELFLTNAFYCSELRDHVYMLAKTEWEHQSSSVSGIFKNAIESMGHWWSGKSALKQAIDLIKEIDRSGKILVEPVQHHYGYNSCDVEVLGFKDSAWLTDDLLKAFAVKMPAIGKFYLKGCFQVTQAGIKAAIEARKQVNTTHPLEITTDVPDDWVIVEPSSSRAPS